MQTLDELLLEDTPLELKELYKGLSSEAQERDFGLLEEDVIILDTETTGLSFRNCELIEVAAARMSGRDIAEEFNCLIKPKKAIPHDIELLTGITNEATQGAPSAEAVIAELSDFVGGRPVIAHNASFDRTFIEAIPGGGDVSELWIDSLALSRIALPLLKSHRLSDMAEAFGCDSVSHRALDDVHALAGIWRILLCGLTKLPTGLLGLFADMHPEIDWEYRPIFSQLAQENPAAQFSLENARTQLVGLEHASARHDAKELPILKNSSSREIQEAFTEGGLVSAMYENYEVRPDQLALAEQLRHALATSTHSAIEAGTGVGKSLGYLLPLAQYAQANNISCGVATKTNALTDQLITQELPALAKQLPKGLSYKSLKGYDHYPCMRKLMRATHSDLPLELAEDKRRDAGLVAADMLTALATSLSFSSQVAQGDLDSLGIRWKSVPRSLLASTSEECQHQNCPFFPSLCMLHGARRRAACADIVVTNHSLLLAHVASGGQVLPPIRHWVIDEAHSFEQEARRQWAIEVSAADVRSTFEMLGGLKSGVLQRLIKAASGTEAQTLCVGLLNKVAASTGRCQLIFSEVFEAAHDLVSSMERANSYDSAVVWLGEEARATPEWAQLSELSLVAIERTGELIAHLEQAVETLKKEKPNAVVDAGDVLRKLQDIHSGLALIVAGKDHNYVYSCEAVKSKLGSERLLAEMVDVGAALADVWYPECFSVNYTSATIAVGNDFSHFEHAVGLDRVKDTTHSCTRLDSSFDFDTNMQIAVMKDMPAPGENSYIDVLEQLLFDTHVKLGGSTLTLFTNKREMDQLFDRLAPRLSQAGLELICQGRGLSARQLRDRFIAEEQLSLFALKSFWEGFDAAGDTLKAVIIPRLPFSNPNEPISRERDLREHRAWWKYSLPEAILAVKQAAGRLIRTASDSGVLILADSRLIQKGYGKQFIESLPSRSVSYVAPDEISSFIERWQTRPKA